MPAVNVVVPMRDERECVESLFGRFDSALPTFERSCRILVVDGQSTDGTPDAVLAFADRVPVELLRLEENRGLGGALEAGLLRAMDDQECRAIVTMDGDDSHDPHTIPTLLDRLDQGYDLVVASRFEDGGREVGVARHRKLLSHAASALLRTLFPVGTVKDYSSGFRAYRPEALARVRERFGRLVRESGFSCMMELLLALRAVGVRAAEVPLVLRYDLKRSESKMEVGPTILRYLAVMSDHLGEAPGRDPNRAADGSASRTVA